MFDDLVAIWLKLEEFGPEFITALSIVLAVTVSFHAAVYKRESRAAVGWVGLAWLSPLVGSLLYYILGINRIERQGARVAARMDRYEAPSERDHHCFHGDLVEQLGSDHGSLVALARVVEEVVGRPLLTGNAVTPLVNGEVAFPAMLEAIEQARQSVSLSTYIFDRDPLGKRFVAALAAAAKREVEVRVLIDAAGSRYSLPSVVGLLRRNGVKVARFLPSAPWRLRYLNLRLHRKLLVVDGRIGFTGGMNLRAGHLVEASTLRRAIRDVQFRIEGPVVARLQENFVTDWAFTTKEQLRGETWFPDLEPRGTVLARGIPDGPDEDIDKVQWTILAALSAARRSVRVVTPYFLPDQPLVSALNLAALRGVEVDIVLPKRNNLPYVNWAAFGLLWQVLGHGCRVWLTQPPFDHTKLMIVDGTWVLLGSANWDPRSLRLNFELNVECYSTELAELVEDLVEARLETAESITRERLAERSLPVKLRDGVARLLKPYL